MKNIPCPCERQHQKQVLRYQQCCARYIENDALMPAPDAESLMRSRYSAFVLENQNYLMQTWLDDYRPVSIDFDAGVKWLGLEVKKYRQLDAEHAEVEFVARSRLNGQASRLHEVSQFVKKEGRWFYVKGTFV